MQDPSQSLAAQTHEQPRLRAGCPITKQDLKEVRLKRQMMVRLGYRTIAVNSPWSLAVEPAGAGKQPLTEVVNGQKQPWARGRSSNRLMRATPLSANTGLLLGGDASLVALDLDPRKDASDASQQSFITDVLFQPGLEPLWWQEGALIRFREPYSVVMLLRADRAMGKIKVAGERGAAELLAEGQQVVVDGYHPRSLSGSPVRWTWLEERSPWTVPAADLPVVPAAELEALMQRIAASGLLEAPLPHASVTTIVANRTSSYDATKRLHTMVEKHEDLVRPATRERVEQIGGERSGRRDALVAIAGRLVLEGWSDQSAILLAGFVNDRFGEGDQTDEIIKALGRARKRVTERAEKKGPPTWH
jgi:hypothetical protein